VTTEIFQKAPNCSPKKKFQETPDTLFHANTRKVTQLTADGNFEIVRQRPMCKLCEILHLLCMNKDSVLMILVQRSLCLCTVPRAIYVQLCCCSG